MVNTLVTSPLRATKPLRSYAAVKTTSVIQRPMYTHHSSSVQRFHKPCPSSVAESLARFRAVRALTLFPTFDTLDARRPTHLNRRAPLPPCSPSSSSVASVGASGAAVAAAAAVIELEASGPCCCEATAQASLVMASAVAPPAAASEEEEEDAPVELVVVVQGLLWEEPLTPPCPSLPIFFRISRAFGLCAQRGNGTFNDASRKGWRAAFRVCGLRTADGCKAGCAVDISKAVECFGGVCTIFAKGLAGRQKAQTRTYTSLPRARSSSERPASPSSLSKRRPSPPSEQHRRSRPPEVQPQMILWAA